MRLHKIDLSTITTFVAPYTFFSDAFTVPPHQSAESMPPGAPLEAERIALVRDWIASGAPND